MDGYRTAECTDYNTLVDLLEKSDPSSVLMKSLSGSEMGPQPLLDFVKGPFTVSKKGISCSFMGGPYHLYITPNEHHYLEIRQDGGDWQSPPSGCVILLIQE